MATSVPLSHFTLAVTDTQLHVFAHPSSPSSSPLSEESSHVDDAIAEVALETTSSLSLSPSSHFVVDFSTSLIRKSNEGDAEIEATAKVFRVVGLVGFVGLCLGNDSEKVPHLTVVTRRRKVGRLGGSDVFVVEQVAVLPCNSSAGVLAALADAVAVRAATSLVQMSPIDSAFAQTRIQAGATVKAGVDLGVGTVKAGVDTVKAGVGIGVGIVSGGVQLASSVGSTALNVLKAPLRSRAPTASKEGTTSEGPSGGEESEVEGTGTVEHPTEDPSATAPTSSPVPPQQKRATASATVTKMVSSLNPFKQAPLHVANTTADDSASESEQLLEEETKASDSSSVRTSRSTILGSLNSLAGGGKKDPVTPESIQPSDIKSLLELQTFFFSTGPWNLTLRASQQSQNETDDRFFWNKAAVKPLADVGLTVAPLIQGFVEVRESVSMSSETSTSPESAFDFALISRRSKYRAGFRYERRGVDEQGHVANFVETEMVVFTKESKVASFLQIRGSIPLYWTQVASTKTLNPTPSLDRSDEENLAALRLHVEELEKLYQAVVVVDLVGKEGREEPLGTRFKTLLQQVSTDHPTITYKDYDFHKETKGLNYDNLKHLLDLLSTDFTTVSHYSSTTGQDQTGVIRTNCMDCLDRTNVVQSILARHVLPGLISSIGVESQTSETADKQFESMFKNVWANNGDCLSTAYTGTGALKGDFTRTGVRNVKGMLNDAANSVTRLYADNFQNKVRQVVVDLLIGV